MTEYYIIPQTLYEVATIDADNSTEAMGDFAFNMDLDMNTYFRAVMRDEYDKYVEELEKEFSRRAIMNFFYKGAESILGSDAGPSVLNDVMDTAYEIHLASGDDPNDYEILLKAIELCTKKEDI